MDKQQRAQATLTAHQSTGMTQTPAKPFSTPMTALCASHKAITARAEGHSIPHPAYSERPFCHCIYPAPVMVRDPQHRKTLSAMSGQSERKETGLEGTLGALPHGPHSEHNKLCSNYPQQMFIQFALKQSEKCPQVPGVRQGLVTFSLGPSLLFNPLLFPVGTESHTAPAVVLRHSNGIAGAGKAGVHGVQLLLQCCHSHHHQFSYSDFHLPLPTYTGGHQVPLIRDYTSSIILMPAAGYFCLNPNLTTVLPHHQPIFRPRLIAQIRFSLLSHVCRPSLLYAIYNLNMHSLSCHFSDE